MFDNYARNINYLRVSVTNRCNLRCKYCMPEEGVEDHGHDGILRFEEIEHLVRVATQIGVRKVRLTGGEPLVCKNITNLIADIARIPQIDDIAMTTNGILFADMADELRRAGLNRVNFSLDSLNQETFRYITSRGDINRVFRSIDKALDMGMAPIKINTVVMKGINDNEIIDFVKMTKTMPLHVRFIEFMPIGDLPFFKTDQVFTETEIKKTIEQKYELHNAAMVSGNGPARYFAIKDGIGTVGFISAMSNHFCGQCNRIRLTADGKLRSCLFGKQEINLKLALHNRVNDDKLAEMFCKAIREKPNRHHMDEGWGADNRRKMYQIGG
ncbi:MAG: moaA 3 [Firmicutes bacterium]|nr:moaA 3 [Bacillota bacterium]